MTCHTYMCLLVLVCTLGVVSSTPDPEDRALTNVAEAEANMEQFQHVMDGISAEHANLPAPQQAPPVHPPMLLSRKRSADDRDDAVATLELMSEEVQVLREEVAETVMALKSAAPWHGSGNLHDPAAASQKALEQQASNLDGQWSFLAPGKVHGKIELVLKHAKDEEEMEGSVNAEVAQMPPGAVDQLTLFNEEAQDLLRDAKVELHQGHLEMEREMYNHIGMRPSPQPMLMQNQNSAKDTPADYDLIRGELMSIARMPVIGEQGLFAQQTHAPLQDLHWPLP